MTPPALKPTSDYFALAPAPGRIEASQVEQGKAAEQAPFRILIVDDVSDNRAILARRFRPRGYEVTEAEGGHAALELIARQPFDLVLLDVMMPDMNGMEVLRAIRAEHTAVTLPVIMVTAKSESQDIVVALESGANDYVTKPVDFNVALARANHQIGRKRAEGELLQKSEELRKTNEHLESLVAQRTAHLAEANLRLTEEIAQRRNSELKVQYLAHHDSLTGLGNRVLFREQLDSALGEALDTGQTLAVLYIDLDGFKAVNDTLGHSAGDALLKLVADRLRDELRITDRIYRLGGDEFAVFQLSKEQPEGAAGVAARLIEAVSEPCTIDEHEVVIGASIGIEVTTGDSISAEQLLKRADMAMYRAKQEGRNTYRFFEIGMDLQIQARRQLESDLRAAFREGRFEIYYQPLFNLATKRVTGFEALLRLPHPVKGFISPGDFIPTAEKMGLIVPLGEWALQQACAEAAKWPEPIRVAVNLSAVQFKNGQLLHTVIAALASSGLPAHRLELEITETVLLHKTEANLDTLRKLRELGVRISMDDFGTGYSSLGYLRDFHFDKIKIDRSFVSDISAENESRAIVRAIAGLGLSFGINTTAEGVETEDQLTCLEADGCTEAQGFLLSPPMPASEVARIIERLNSR